MAKKLFKALAVIILVLIAIPLVWTIQDSADDFDSIILTQLAIALAVYLVVGIVFGVLCDHVARSKGYESGFAWGFWLGLIGLLVVGFRPSLKKPVVQKPTDIEVLSKLAALHKQGILTDDEFHCKKAEILKKI